jgi:hypothetical protein
MSQQGGAARHDAAASLEEGYWRCRTRCTAALIAASSIHETILLRRGLHQATAFQETSRTARREIVPQAMVQGASWRLRRLRDHAALAVGLWRGSLCAVSPAC